MSTIDLKTSTGTISEREYVAWRERIGIAFFYGFMWGVVFPAMFIGAFWLLGAIIENSGQRSADHDRCMKRATNGYQV